MLNKNLAGKTLYRKVNRSLGKNQKKAVRQIVKKEVNKMSELKFVDQDLGELAANSTSGIQFTKINPPAQQGAAEADSPSLRQGDSVYVTSIELRGHFSCQSTKDAQLRVMVIKWLEDDATNAPAVAKVFANTDNAHLMSSHLVRNPANQFKVLYDRVVSFDANNTGARKHLNIRFYGKKLGQKKMSFNAGAITGIGNYYVVTMGSQTAGQLAYTQTRLNFRDL